MPTHDAPCRYRKRRAFIAPLNVTGNIRKITTSVSEGSKIYRATLDYPVGINATYSSAGKFHKNAKAEVWFQKAILDLRQQGFKRIAGGTYWGSFSYLIKTVRMDIDGCAKSCIDATASALDINDSCILHLQAWKVKVSHYKDQSLHLKLVLYNTEDCATSEELFWL